jgi:hypothetical protein
MKGYNWRCTTAVSCPKFYVLVNNLASYGAASSGEGERLQQECVFFIALAARYPKASWLFALLLQSPLNFNGGLESYDMILHVQRFMNMGFEYIH